MALRVGIPRALLYYSYYPAWKVFFEEIGAEVILSKKTSREIVTDGIKNAVDEACLPVKIFYGHVISLKDKVDYLFVPRLVSVEKKARICPKFLGLPEMIKYGISGLPPIIDTVVDLSNSPGQIFNAAWQIGKVLQVSPLRLFPAFLKARRSLENYQKLLLAGYLPEEAMEIMQENISPREKVKGKKLTILLLGHPYSIYDAYFSMNLLDKIKRMGVSFITPEMIRSKSVEKYWRSFPRKMYWTFGRKNWGGASYFIEHGGIDGIIYLTAFGCGIDSFLGELIEREVRKAGNMPFMFINIDEHTGEAGMLTRLEAFIDMIKWREAQ